MGGGGGGGGGGGEGSGGSESSEKGSGEGSGEESAEGRGEAEVAEQALPPAPAADPVGPPAGEPSEGVTRTPWLSLGIGLGTEEYRLEHPPHGGQPEGWEQATGVAGGSAYAEAVVGRVEVESSVHAAPQLP